MSPRKRVSPKRSLRMLSAAMLGLIAISAVVVADDLPTTITGQAILVHPAGKAAIEAGKLDEVKLASAKDTRDEWAAMPAAEKQEEAERQQAKVPDPKTFEADIANSGTLIIYVDSATLRTESASGEMATLSISFNSRTENPDGSISYSSESTGLAYQLENGKWRIGDEL